MLLHNNRGGNYVIMNTVRCIYILERKHLLILVNIWLLFIWYICTYAAVMQLCSELRWHCFWSHVVSTVFFLAYTDDHEHFMSFKDALSSFYLWCFNWLGQWRKWGSKTQFVLLWFLTHSSCFFLFSLCKTRCTQIQGATMISQ